MNVSDAAAVLVTVLVFYVGVRYCVKLVRRRIAPRLATWLIFEIGVVMSLASYLSGNDHHLLKAAVNVADSLQVTAILVVLLIAGRKEKVQFTPGELASMGVACVAAAVWLGTKTGWIGFLGFQVVMCLAYLPTFEGLWCWKGGASPEPMDKWATNVLIALLGIAVDVTGRHDYLAMIYPLRALLLCLVVVMLIGRWQRKSKAPLLPVR